MSDLPAGPYISDLVSDGESLIPMQAKRFPEGFPSARSSGSSNEIYQKVAYVWLDPEGRKCGIWRWEPWP